MNFLDAYCPMGRIVDDEGRPLDEHRTAPDLLVGVPMERKTCAYSGSRYHHPKPMNVSALRQMQAHWDEMLELFSWARALAKALAARRTIASPPLIEMWRITKAIVEVPRFFAYRAGTGPARVPAATAAAYKAALDVNTAFLRLTIESLIGALDATPICKDAQSLHDFAEASGLFIGEQGVCAGPATLVKRSLDALFFDEPSTAPRAPQLDVEAFTVHVGAAMNYQWLSSVYGMIDGSLYAQLHAVVGGRVPLREPGRVGRYLASLEPDARAAALTRMFEAWWTPMNLSTDPALLATILSIPSGGSPALGEECRRALRDVLPDVAAMGIDAERFLSCVTSHVATLLTYATVLTTLKETMAGALGLPEDHVRSGVTGLAPSWSQCEKLLEHFGVRVEGGTVVVVNGAAIGDFHVRTT